ncbi:MAG: UDP-N-acetylmuramate dehydrogenase [Desulfuromonadales bacterium]|nr:UDP-N-acetylmuramate dehydrogenase [Desulfuromonadales bacterium]
MLDLALNVSLKKMTTYHIGGEAKSFVLSNSQAELTAALKWCDGNLFPWFLIGYGSNILVADEGFPGLVIKLAGEFTSIEFDDNSRVISIGAAVMLPKLANECAKRGISGFEGLCGIPGTVGAAVRINAGTKEGEVKDLFVSADILDEQGNVRTLSSNDMGFGHRTSLLMQNRWIVLRSRFSYGLETESAKIFAQMLSHRASRKAKQPSNPKNCGSVFKPANGRAAGWYIEQCGLKGRRIGDAMIATEHANWIVNLGAASASDVKLLIRLAQDVVKERFGVLLEREVEYVPEDLIGVSSNEL